MSPRAIEELAAGPRTVEWDGCDSGGRHAPAGVYFVRLVAGAQRLERRCVVLR